MAPTPADTSLVEYVPGRIWTKKYPIHYAGCDFFARATLIRLTGGDVLVHSPCPIDDALLSALGPIGRVAHVIAPGTYHYFHVADWQRAFPEATVWICPGVERKRRAPRAPQTARRAARIGGGFGHSVLRGTSDVS